MTGGTHTQAVESDGSAPVELLPIEDPSRVPAPDWARHLVIYEVNPRGFTSPSGSGDGSGSGTFRSLADKAPYLAELGVTAVWLAGYHESTDHFYGIWSVYAARRFDHFDPALGSEDDFRHLVETLHGHGIRVLLEVVAHGAVDDSPHVAEHPDWFLPDGSWGMRDFDYANPEFRSWWVDLWLEYVTEHGVDGFRVDLELFDVALWDEIARRAADAGHPIVVMPEHGRYHFSQQDWFGLSPDIAADWNANRLRFATQQITCHDAGWSSPPGSYYRLHGSRARFGYCAAFSHRIPLFFAGEEFDAQQESLPGLRRGIFGAGGPGGWLYGCQVPWHQLEDPARQAYLDDVRRMLAIRREHSDLLNADRWENDMVAVAAQPEPLLVPYARFRRGEKAIVVAGNEEPTPLELRLQLPLERLGLAGAGSLRLDDLWRGSTRTVDESEVAEGFQLELAPDSEPGGGLAVICIRTV